MVSKECPTLKAIIYTRNYTTAESPAHPEKVNGVKVLSMDEAVELGKANPTPMEAPTPDHVGLIMYTSGALRFCLNLIPIFVNTFYFSLRTRR